MTATMTKSDYAAHRGVSPGRISQYISDGKIGPNAIDGSGQRARVIVAVADKQLGERLDPSQALGANGAATRSAAPIESPAPDVPSDAPEYPVLPLTPQESAMARAAEEKAKQAEIQTQRMLREEAAALGRYMLTADARNATARAVNEVLAIVDASLREMADAVAADCDVEAKPVLTAIRKAWREARAKHADAQRQAAEAHPPHIADEAKAATP